MAWPKIPYKHSFSMEMSRDSWQFFTWMQNVLMLSLCIQMSRTICVKSIIANDMKLNIKSGKSNVLIRSIAIKKITLDFNAIRRVGEKYFQNETRRALIRIQRKTFTYENEMDMETMRKTKTRLSSRIILTN